MSAGPSPLTNALNQMHSAEAIVRHRTGLHIRPAMQIVDAIAKLNCVVRLSNGDRHADGRSIIEVILLAAEEGARVSLEAHGPDALTAIRHLSGLISPAEGILATG